VQTDWLDSPEVCADLKKGAFDFATIKDVPTTIYLVLPPEYLASHGTWLRIMVSSILRPLLRSVEGRAVPVLFMLDEFAQLGHMEMIEDNYALMRGYGVKLWTIFQDLNQAKILYKDRWESFISNAGIVQAFAPQDMTTRKYLSDLADERMTWIDKESKSSHVSGVNVSGGTSTAPTNIKEPLMYPYELGQMQQGQSVLFTARGHVLRSYFPDAATKGFAGVADMMAEAARNIGP
jgi:type IV secretion system protein VirD4